MASMIVKKVARSELAGLLARMSASGNTESEAEVHLLTFCLNCPDPFGALNAVLDAPRGSTDEEITELALAMPARPIEHVLPSELPSNHPLRTMALEQ